MVYFWFGVVGGQCTQIMGLLGPFWGKFVDHGGLAGTGPFTPTPPPLLEIGLKVPDHGRQRRPKEILLELVEDENGFPPHVSILKILSFLRITQ